MSTNVELNGRAVRELREKLRGLGRDVPALDKSTLTQAANEGLAMAKLNTPVVTGFLRKSWAKTPTVQHGSVTETSVINTADYALYWNNGHRIVRGGRTVGFVTGSFLREKVREHVRSRFNEIYKGKLK